MLTILAIAIAWLIVSGFACIVAGKFFAVGDPGDDGADQLADTHTTHSEVRTPRADRGDAVAVFGGVATDVSSFHGRRGIR